MKALTRLLVCACLVGAAGALAADPALPINRDDPGGASARDDIVYAAAFNPFASVGMAVDPPAIAPPAHTGDLALPLVVALGGMIGVGVLIRRFLD
jgi:hypothetical protein